MVSPEASRTAKLHIAVIPHSLTLPHGAPSLISDPPNEGVWSSKHILVTRAGNVVRLTKLKKKKRVVS